MGIGFASRIISPRVPCALAGYAVKRPCEGIHDDLYARCIAFGERESSASLGKPFVIIQMDLLGIDRICAEPIRERLGALGLTRDRILISATHTHSAFGGFLDIPGVRGESCYVTGEKNQALIDALINNDYEALLSRFAPGQGERYIEEAVSLFYNKR
ncbi:MAG: neutral/alkaline non-lysosomal ceramidase N-terminal domain-containing protein [Treponema sp.]|nr:neutral/alkaline non-lysosomal ceramidase N-terminal domain-containing protein [Treponema sp.]